MVRLTEQVKAMTGIDVEGILSNLAGSGETKEPEQTPKPTKPVRKPRTQKTDETDSQ
jgi:hypothetical protein